MTSQEVFLMTDTQIKDFGACGYLIAVLECKGYTNITRSIVWDVIATNKYGEVCAFTLDDLQAHPVLKG